MKLGFLGDVMLGRLVNETLRTRSPATVWGDTLPLLKSLDSVVCNLECAMSDRGEPWSSPPKEFYFRSDTRNIGALSAAGFRAVSIANNHTIDYGYNALSDTLHVLDKAGIRHAGAGLSFKEASSLASIGLKDLEIGLLAITDNQQEWESDVNQPGVYFVPIDLSDARAKRLLESVEEAKEKSDILVVSAHWGGNWGYKPPKEHVEFAHALVDAGADIIFGHSCHVFRGVEVYRERPIIYSAGDFVDDYAVDPDERNDESFVFVAETTDLTITRLLLYPTKIEDCAARIARSSEKFAIVQKMKFLCSRMKTSCEWKENEHGYLEISIQTGA